MTSTNAASLQLWLFFFTARYAAVLVMRNFCLPRSNPVPPNDPKGLFVIDSDLQ